MIAALIGFAETSSTAFETVIGHSESDCLSWHLKDPCGIRSDCDHGPRGHCRAGSEGRRTNSGRRYRPCAGGRRRCRVAGVPAAKIYGASQVIGLASAAEKRVLAQSFGADAVFDYTRDGWSEAVLEATCGKGVDLALEMTGGVVFHETLKAVEAQFGRVVIYDNASDQAVEFNSCALVGRNMSLTGFLLPAARALVPEILKELADFVQDGRLKPAIGGVHALHEAATAHRALETRASTGSLVLVL
jgi:D-arabinose 1-dehydrogenase-like Zn-dependent alcohol dehydrogenase